MSSCCHADVDIEASYQGASIIFIKSVEKLKIFDEGHKLQILLFSTTPIDHIRCAMCCFNHVLHMPDSRMQEHTLGYMYNVSVDLHRVHVLLWQ